MGNPKEYLHAKAFQNGIADFPKHLDLEINSACNFNCSFCPQSEPEKQIFKQGKMDIVTAKKIIQFFAKNGTETVKLFWRGEPTINPDLPEILKYCKEQNLFTMINTNGSFPLKNEKEIIPYLDWISFSIDDFHVDRKGERNQNQKMFNRVLQFKQAGIITQIQTTTPNPVLDTFCALENVELKVDEATKRTDSNYEHVDLTKKQRKDCGFANWRMIISWDLFIHVCCVTWGQEELVMGKVDLNNLSGIKQIWHGAQYKALREDQKTLNFRHKACQTCVSPSAYCL